MANAEAVLRVFLTSYRDIVEADPLEKKLAAIAAVLVRAGLFQRAAVQVYASLYGEKLFGLAGLTPQEEEWIRTHDILPEEEYARVQQHGVRIEEVYFVPHEHLRSVLPNVDDVLLMDASRDPDDWQEGQWHPDDMLYMPLLASNGLALGNITADAPFDNRVPDEETAALLAPFVAMAACTIEQELNRRRDYLTQCFNGQFFRDEVSRRLSMRGRPLGLAFVDMNGLKAVNDDLGHEAGDRAIQATADALRALGAKLAGHLFYDPVVCRLYGDEFGLLFRPDAAVAPDEVAAAMLAHWPEDVPPAAVGVAGAEPEDDPRTLVRRAEERMYAAKRAMRPPGAGRERRASE